MSNNNTNKLVEPKVKGKPISYVKTQESLQEARNRYREKSDGLFDCSSILGSKFNSHIRHLKGCCDDIAKDNLEEKMFGQEEYEDTIKALSLPGVVFYGYFTWRGEGGNYRSDPRFDAEETYDETEETKLRAEFIDALFKYATAAAAKADKLGNKTVKKQFMSVLPKLKDMKSSDPEAPWSNNDAKVVANAIFEASEVLWSEWQVVLRKREDIPDDRETALLYNEIHKILMEIDEYFKETQAKIENVFDPQESQNLAQSAIKRISNRTQVELLPLVIRYGKAEEAEFFDDSYITEALKKLCRHCFFDSKERYEAALRYVEDISLALHHPVTVYSEGVWDITSNKEQGKEYIIESMQKLVEFAGNASLMDKLIEKIDRIDKNTQKPVDNKDDVLELIWDVQHQKNWTMRGGLKKAVDYVKNGCTKEDTVFYQRCIDARKYVLRTAKKTKDGIEKRWRSLEKEAAPSYQKNKNKKKNKNRAPGPCAILDRGVENM